MMIVSPALTPADVLAMRMDVAMALLGSRAKLMRVATGNCQLATGNSRSDDGRVRIDGMASVLGFFDQLGKR